jgi:subtilase family serine protease
MTCASRSTGRASPLGGRQGTATGIVLSGVLAAVALAAGVPGAPPNPPSNVATADCRSLTSCYSPRQLEEAYGILPLLEHGTNGRGETVVLPELAEPQFPLPTIDIRHDLDQFDRLFDLPVARLHVVTSLARSASPWSANGEEVLDTEMVHAVAPGAAIVEVLVPATSLDSPANAVPAAVAALCCRPDRR